MANREQPYDPYIPAGGASQGGNTAQDGGNQRTAALQAVGNPIPFRMLLMVDKARPKSFHRFRVPSPTFSAQTQQTKDLPSTGNRAHPATWHINALSTLSENFLAHSMILTTSTANR